jgi:hypothetical protein
MNLAGTVVPLVTDFHAAAGLGDYQILSDRNYCWPMESSSHLLTKIG